MYYTCIYIFKLYFNSEDKVKIKKKSEYQQSKKCRNIKNCKKLQQPLLFSNWGKFALNPSLTYPISYDFKLAAIQVGLHTYCQLMPPSWKNVLYQSTQQTSSLIIAVIVKTGAWNEVNTNEMYNTTNRQHVQ